MNNITNEPNKYLKNFLSFFCLIIFLGIIIYIMEIFYEKKYKKKRNKGADNINTNNNLKLNQEQVKDNKLYFSI